MLKHEFLAKVEGMPWRNRACSFEGADCWGLIVLYYRHVMGIELHDVPGYESESDFSTCFHSEIIFWSRVEIFGDSDMFVAYYGAEPVHVGLVVDGRALHSRGENGHVRSDNLRTITKLFTRVEFYTYASDRDTAHSGSSEGTGGRAGGCIA